MNKSGRGSAKATAVTTYGADFGRPTSTKAQPNTLLVKYPVGKAKPSSYTLPPNEHVYGRGVDRKPDETTAKVLSNWQTKQKSKNAEPALDYVAMNKQCIHEGIVDPRAQYEHRKTHPIRVKVIDHSTPGRRALRRLPSDTDPLFTYGKPTRPSSPVAKLMSDHYEREYMAMLEAERARADAAAAASGSHANRTPRTLREQVVPLQRPKPKHLTIYERDVDSLFKMPRFRDVAGRVDCHREVSAIGGI
ncbi:hypothetical protein H9P43_005380 [Blastocladiella emersonii ATCC 22665]|nr:hypothetical protein H9P43_005380 [Blastocladiella emersonii ATCC 22665]